MGPVLQGRQANWCGVRARTPRLTVKDQAAVVVAGSPMRVIPNTQTANNPGHKSLGLYGQASRAISTG